MSETRAITCDQCENDLISNTSYPAKYSLELKAINTNINNTGLVFSVIVHPPLDSTKHFCDIVCLKKFLNN